MNYHSGIITKKQNDGKSIFVFGSNLAGRHGKGSALTAKQHWGAIYGKGEGIQGFSYGIPTKNEHLQQQPFSLVESAVKRFITYAYMHPYLKFYVVRIGCMLAGFTDNQIAPLFAEVQLIKLENVYLPPEWKSILEPELVSNIDIISKLNG